MLTTGWNPLAGAPANIIDEVKQTLGSEYDAHDPQSALEVRPYLCLLPLAKPIQMLGPRWLYKPKRKHSFLHISSKV